MGRFRPLRMVLAAVVGAILFAGAGASASAKTTVLRYFGKQTSSIFTTSTGAPVSSTAPPVAGDELFSTSNLYVGTAKHHAKTWTASAALHCTIVSASSTSVPGSCEGVIAIGGSMLISLSTQSLASSGALTVFPITGGTGVYARVKGTVRALSVGKTSNDNFVITIRG